jgi:hypothetical protein
MNRSYHEAARLRKRAEREEEERIRAENEDLSADNERLQKRARRAEQDYYNVLDSVHVLEERETARIFSMMIARMIEDRNYRAIAERLVESIEERLLIRVDTHRHAPGIALGIENRTDGDMVAFEVVFPAMRMTIMEDAKMLELTTGKRGPVIMEDRPLRVVQYNPRAYTVDPTGPAPEVTFKTI